MSYPDYPKNRLIVGGVDLTERFHLILLDGYELEPPSPKTYTVDIPGGDGVIDLTDTLTGNVAYNNRTQKFSFALMNMKGVNDVSIQKFEHQKTEIMNFLHGKAFDYQMTMDPDYTYHGRFTVSSHAQSMYSNGRLGAIEITIDAEPYKLKENCTYKLNATGGKLFRLESGRKPVHPTLECAEPCQVTWDGNQFIVPAGTYRLNDVTFQDGWNEIYINSHQFWNITWGEVDEGGTHEMTWGGASSYRWDDIQRLEGDYLDVPRSWEEIATQRWSDLASITWGELNFKTEDAPEVLVYLQYEWKDL